MPASSEALSAFEWFHLPPKEIPRMRPWSPELKIQLAGVGPSRGSTGEEKQRAETIWPF